jgi:hypothetical protein
MVHTFLPFYNSFKLSLLETEPGNQRWRLPGTKLYRKMCCGFVLFYLETVYLTTLLLAQLATSGESVGMWRSVATVSLKLIHTILGALWTCCSHYSFTTDPTQQH